MISVVIPAYNVEKYFEKCLQSVVSQTYTDLEIIIVDDGSSDNTLNIAKSFGDKDSRIKIFEQKNAGAGAARNYGIKQATGEYIIFLDSDDYFEENMLESMYDRIVVTGSDVCVVKSWEFDDNTGEECLIDYSIIDGFVPDSDEFNWKTNGKYIFNFCNGWPWDKLYRRTFIEEHDIRFQEIRTSNDTFFVLSTLAYADKICIIRTPFIHHRINNKESLSFTREKSWDCCFRAANAVFNALGKTEYFDTIKQSLYDCMGTFLYWHFTSIGDNYRERVYNGIKDMLAQYGMLDAPREAYIEPFHRDFFQKVKDFSYSEYMLYEKITMDMRWYIDESRRSIIDSMRENEQLRQEVQELTRQRDEALAKSDAECKRVCRSATYRLGNVILFIPKKLVNLIFRTHY